MAYAFANDQLMMHKIWRKALREGKVSFDLPTVSDAVQMRFGLYNSIRPVRTGKVFDEELLRASRDCQVTLKGTSVIVQAKVMTEVMQAVMAVLGEDAKTIDNPLLSEEEHAIQESARLLLEKLGNPQAREDGSIKIEPETPTRSTPYYTR
jgi:hypothetical protein